MSDFVNIRERKFRYPDGKCFDFDINIKLLNSFSKVLSLILGFNDENTTITMRITDPHREYFLSDVFTFSGKEINKTLSPEYKPTMDIFKVQVQENIDCEEDKESNCEEYENGKMMKSFKQCVQSVVEEQFLKQFGCMPPWSTENMADICEKYFSNEQWKNISDLIFPTL